MFDWLSIIFGQPSTPSTSVPEIDATTGSLAIAAVAACLLLAVELRRRAR